jgi:hypothetical protein
MKTINNTQETENRNFKNSTMKTFVVLTSAAMFGFIFQATASNNQLPGADPNYFPSPLAIGTSAHALDAASVPLAFTEAASEASLVVENWMTNENLFAPLAVSESEAPMEVEEWMTKAENFLETTFTPENNQPLEVESWMLNNENFSNFNITQEREKALAVENWMLETTTWGK